MGATQSSSQTQDVLQEAIQTLQQQHFLTPKQVSQIEKLTPSEKRHLHAVIKQDEKQFHENIRQILSQAKQKSEKQQKQAYQSSPHRYFTPKEREQFKELDPLLQQKVVQQLPSSPQKLDRTQFRQKVDRAIEKAKERQSRLKDTVIPISVTDSEQKKWDSLPASVKKDVKEKLLKAEKRKNEKESKVLKKKINVCKSWKNTKAIPKNPVSGRSLKSKQSKNYKLLDKICHDPKTVCANPDKSPFGRKKTYVPSSKNAKFIRNVCSKISK